MGNSSSSDVPDRLSWWQRFWHEPVRAERLALMRILLGLALLFDQAFQFWPYLLDLFGPEGLAPAGLHDPTRYDYWHWTALFFTTDDPTILYATFGLWVAVTVLWTVGWQTRLMNVALWVLTLCFLQRNPCIRNGGDNVLQIGLFLLMLSPCGRALSLDAWLARRQSGETGPVYVEPWSLRLIQLKLCMIYFATGLIKLKGEWDWGKPFFIKGTWWDGTTIHDVLNFIDLNRYPFPQFPLPFWATASMTYTTVWWEALFPLLVLVRYTRTPALLLGIALHLGIYATVEVGGFSFFILSFYGAWVSCDWWRRRDEKRAGKSPLPA